MKVIARNNLKIDKIIVPKNAEGWVIAVSNSIKIKESFPLEHKIDGWFYIVRFPGFIDEILCSQEQLDLT